MHVIWARSELSEITCTLHTGAMAMDVTGTLSQAMAAIVTTVILSTGSPHKNSKCSTVKLELVGKHSPNCRKKRPSIHLSPLMVVRDQIYWITTEMAQEETHMSSTNTKEVTARNIDVVSSIIRKNGWETTKFTHTRRPRWIKGCKIHWWFHQFTNRWQPRKDKRIKVFTKTRLIRSKGCKKVQNGTTSSCYQMSRSHQWSSKIQLQNKFRWIGWLLARFIPEKLQSKWWWELRHKRARRESKRIFCRSSKNNRRRNCRERCLTPKLRPNKTMCQWLTILVIWGKVMAWVKIS